MDEPIITSLLDTDLYKLTMMNAVRIIAPDAIVEYTFVCRTPGANEVLVQYVLPRLKEQIAHLCGLRFQGEELQWMGKHVPYLPSSFVDFSLRRFSLLSSCVDAGADEEGRFYLKIRGPWFDTILFETPVLAIIEELWMDRQIELHPEIEDALKFNLDAKIEFLQRQADVRLGHLGDLRSLSLTDMGTRRRRSKKWHKFVVRELDRCLGTILQGTSNVQLAKELGLKCFGTMAHEWVQAFQGMTRFDLSQQHALNAWQRVYGGNFGIALSDTLGTPMFLRDFDRHLANAFTGARHDSGNPIAWGNTILDHYERLGIDPLTKTLVFSDGLNFEQMLELYDCFGSSAKLGFGIGTFLTNDSVLDGVKHRIDIVLKMTMFDGHPVIKLSNDMGKAICTSEAYHQWAIEQIARRLAQ